MTRQNSTRLSPRLCGENQWLSRSTDPGEELEALNSLKPSEIQPDVFQDEDSVGQAMLKELEDIARSKEGDIVMILLGGRGAQALHRQLGIRAAKGPDELIGRLHVFTQDALAPLPMASSLSFVSDFRRLLGPAFFSQVKSFTPMFTESNDLSSELADYVARIDELGGPDIFFLGHGPEPGDASHLAYIRTGSGASILDAAGLIPISPLLLDHHISKFKAGGATVSEEDESRCRAATHILTLGPDLILNSHRVVQSVVDASTAPAKKRTYKRVVDTVIASDPQQRRQQLDENPGLWVRFHQNFRSIILPDVLS